jgi:Ca2+-binding EF-hand superfamily protein
MRIVVIGLMNITLIVAVPVPAAAVAPANPEITVTGRHAPAPKPLVGGANFMSPMGEPFRSKDALSGAEHWFEQADTNQDGRLTPDEIRADADRFFNVLDTNRDGEIGPDEINRYETQIAPEVRVVSTYGDLSLATTDSDGKVVDPPYPSRLGAGRYGYLGMPEPVLSADTNFDLAVSRAEFREAANHRFKMLDTEMEGAIVRAELPRLESPRHAHRHH